MSSVDRFLTLFRSDVEATGQLVAKSCVEAFQLGARQLEALASMTAGLPTALTGAEARERRSALEYSPHWSWDAADTSWQAMFRIALVWSRLAAEHQASLAFAATEAMRAWGRALEMTGIEAMSDTAHEPGIRPAPHGEGPRPIAVWAVATNQRDQAAPRKELVHREDVRQAASPIGVE